MRIIAGQHKGRRLLSPPPGATTRPITGLAKKSLFDTLAGRLDGAAVADLYCGTGTQGLEAISRGARTCRFAERDRRVLARLRRNIEMLGEGERCTVWSGDVPRRLAGWLAGLDAPLDIALVDPPYAVARQWSWAEAGEKIFAPLADHLSDDGIVVLRAPAKIHVPDAIGTLACIRRKVYGDMALVFFGARE